LGRREGAPALLARVKYNRRCPLAKAGKVVGMPP